MAFKPLIICHLKYQHSYVAGVLFVRNTGHLDEAITTIVNDYIATCS